MSEIPYGYCHCGCSQKTRISEYTSRKYGYIRGEPQNYLTGHKGHPNESKEPNPGGFCFCGCGQKTNIAIKNLTRLGWVRGKPQKYVLGHNTVPYLPKEKRFWSYVDIKSEKECWEWLGGKDRNGYGLFLSKRASRFSYYLSTGKEPPSKIEICHSCDNPPCVNPSHLFAGSRLDNVRDMYSKGRQNPPRGSKHHWAKLTDEQVYEIRKLREANKTVQSIATAFGVSFYCIYGIIKRKTWKHLP